MKKILLVLEFELKEYLKNKMFVGTTLAIALLGALLLCLPTLFDLSEVLPVPSKGSDTVVEEETEEPEEETEISYYVKDEQGILTEAMITEALGEDTWKYVTEENIEEAIKAEEIDAGFVIRSYDEMDYYVLNKGMMNMEKEMLEAVLVTAGQMKYCEEHNLDFEEKNCISEHYQNMF